MPFVSKIVLNNRGNFLLKLFSRFKDIAVFVVVSFLLPHPVDAVSVLQAKLCHTRMAE